MCGIKKIILAGTGCVITACAFSQVLFTYGANEVTKDEFLNAYHRNINQSSNKTQSLKEYLDLYAAFKLKVRSAKDQKLDTLSLLKYDLINFRQRLVKDYPVNADVAIKGTNYKRSSSVKDEDLFRFADSVTLIPGNKDYAIGKKIIFTLENAGVKVSEWLTFVKDYKLNYSVYKGENNQQLLDSFIKKTAVKFYEDHLEDYSADFRYQLQLFAEGNLMYEVMKRNVWSKSAGDAETLSQYYETNKDHFLWNESAEVIVVNARYYAYAVYALENMQQGKDWRKISATSEGMILADSGRYELAQLPFKTGTAIAEGSTSEIVKNEGDNGASFARVTKIYPAKQQRSFDEARNMVINEYQNILEQKWMNELAQKYPIKINDKVFKLLTDQDSK